MAIINTLGGTSLPTLTRPAYSDDIISGRQAIDANGNIITGDMPNVTMPIPTISIASNGLITAKTVYPTNGYIPSGSTFGTRQIDSASVPTLKPENIKSGVNILGVTGTFGSGGSGNGYFHGTQSNGVQLTKSAKLEFSFSGVDWTDIMYWGDYKSSLGYPVFCGMCNGPASSYSSNGFFVCSSPQQSGQKVVRSSSSGGNTKVTADLTLNDIDYFNSITVIAIKI